MMVEKDEMRYEIKELIDLVRLDEKYSALVADGIIPVDHQSMKFNYQRRARIEELSRKYGLV
jgi:hypothetical protein